MGNGTFCPAGWADSEDTLSLQSTARVRMTLACRCAKEPTPCWVPWQQVVKLNRGETVRGQFLTIDSEVRLRHSLHPAMSPAESSIST